MSSPPKPPPRFLPTLTEVVTPRPGESVASPPTGGQTSIESEEIAVQQVLNSLRGPLSHEISEATLELIQQHTQELQAYIEQEVMKKISPWLEQAIRQQLEIKKP